MSRRPASPPHDEEAVFATTAGAGGVRRRPASSSSIPLRDMAEDIARSVRAAVAGEVRGLKEEIGHLRRGLEEAGEGRRNPKGGDGAVEGGDEEDAVFASRDDPGGSGKAEAVDIVGGGIGHPEDDDDDDNDDDDELDLSTAEFTFAAGTEFAFAMTDEDECEEEDNSSEEHGEEECESVDGAGEDDDARKRHAPTALSGTAVLAVETGHFLGDGGDRSGGSRPIRDDGNRRPIESEETRIESPNAVLKIEEKEADSRETESSRAVRLDRNSEHREPTRMRSGSRRTVDTEETEPAPALARGGRCKVLVTVVDGVRTRNEIPSEGDVDADDDDDDDDDAADDDDSVRGGEDASREAIVDDGDRRAAAVVAGVREEGGRQREALPSPTMRRTTRRRGEEEEARRPAASPRARRNRKRGPAPEWPCGRCTYSNRAARRTCEMCRLPKPKGGSAAAAGGGDDGALEKEDAPPPRSTTAAAAPSLSAAAAAVAPSSSDSSVGGDGGEHSCAKKRPRDDPDEAAPSAAAPLRSDSDRGDDNDGVDDASRAAAGPVFVFDAADEVDEAEREGPDAVPGDVKELFGNRGGSRPTRNDWTHLRNIERSATDDRRDVAERGSDAFFGDPRKEEDVKSPRRPQCQLQPSTTPPPARKKFYGRGRCGACPECLKEDCGECVMCRDMVKFGGKAVRRQRCMRRQKCERKRGRTKDWAQARARSAPSPSAPSRSAPSSSSRDAEDENEDEDDEWDDDDDQFEADLRLAIRMSQKEQEGSGAADDDGEMAPTVDNGGGTGAGAPPPAPPPPRTVEGVSVGSRIEVYWSDDDEYYPCRVERFAPILEPDEGGGWRAHLLYDDNVREAVDLRKERFRWCKGGRRCGPRRRAVGVGGGSAPRKKVGRRCGRCSECLKEDCLECRYCRNMTKYGGPGTMRQRCVLRGKCLGNGGLAAVATQGVEEASTDQRHEGEIASKAASVGMPVSSHERNREETGEDDDSRRKEGPAGFVAQLAPRDEACMECGPKTLPGQETSEKAAYHKLEPVQPQLCFAQNGFAQPTKTIYSNFAAGGTREATAWWNAKNHWK